MSGEKNSDETQLMLPAFEEVAEVVGAVGHAMAGPEAASAPIGMRTDIWTMLLPVFANDQTTVECEMDGHKLRVYVEGEEHHQIAGPVDRKILNFLAGAIARRIRSGMTASRHFQVDIRPLIETLRAEGTVGGAEYERLIASLNRLMATVIETTIPLGNGDRQESRFRWIDSYRNKNRETAGGKAIHSLSISLSEEAYCWMTTSLGMDIAKDDFAAITATRSSVWRIYEICLAHLIHCKARTVAIPIDELRQRIPIRAELKDFKRRTLRLAFEAIEQSPQMSKHIVLRLERKVGDKFQEIDFTKRTRHDELYVRVLPGRAPLPIMNVLIPVDAYARELATSRARTALMEESAP